MTQMTWIACLLIGGLAGWLTAAVKKQRIIDGLQAEIDDSIPLGSFPGEEAVARLKAKDGSQKRLIESLKAERKKYV